MTEPTDDATTAIEAARAADAKSGSDVVVLEVGPVLSLCEHFVIASGTSTRQVRAIADEVEAKVAEAGGGKPLRVEGLGDLTWVLIDYGDLVVHVFLEETRRYYDLERLWSDVPRVEWRGAGQPVSPGPAADAG
jgi:ribosome-associated protein